MIRVRKQGLRKKGERYLPSPPVSCAGRREVLGQGHQSGAGRQDVPAERTTRGLAGEGTPSTHGMAMGLPSHGKGAEGTHQPTGSPTQHRALSAPSPDLPLSPFPPPRSHQPCLWWVRLDTRSHVHTNCPKSRVVFMFCPKICLQLTGWRAFRHYSFSSTHV